MTIRTLFGLMGPGPGAEGRPLYNDIQCGNGPVNNARDEPRCPGLVEYGRAGCGQIVLQLPESAGMIYNSQFGKTLRKSVDSVVVLADRANHRICAFRGVRAYMSAASSLGWDLEQGHLFPEIGPNGDRLAHPVKPAKMRENLVAHLGRANLPKHFSMHSFRVGGSVSESLAGTAVYEIMKLGGWRSERVAADYIGATTSDATKGKRRQFDAAYDAADKLPLSPAFKRAYGACRRR
eukprot:g3917.t1